MLRCVDIPAGHRRSDGTQSTTYDRVDNDSDGCSSSGVRVSRSNGDNIASTSKTNLQSNADILKRPPMKIPEPSSSSTDDDDGGDTYPSTGFELMKDIESRIRAKDNRGLTATLPKSDNFTPRGQQTKAKAAQQQPKTQPPPKKLAESSSDEDYDYTSINDLARPLDRAKFESANPNRHSRYWSTTFLPECFQSIKVIDSVSNPLGLASQFEWKTYLSSEAFFSQFAETFYYWSQKMDDRLQDPITSTHKASICCTLVTPASNCQYKSAVEFLPVIPVAQWPDVAREWKTRKRNSVLDKRTNISYTWPRPTQVEKITNQGCHLTTEGGKFRGRFSSTSKLEWQLSFGVANEILLSSLTESHLRALLWARLIFRHAVASIGVLSSHHVDTIFFWLVEENYIDWQETSLGERIMSLFQTLYACVKRRKLPHFYIQRNLLDTKAPKDLVKAQENLYRLIENFVPLTMKTVKQLQSSNTTFPLPDLDRLWEIVTTPLTLASINPALQASSRTLSGSISSIDEIKRAKKKSMEEKEGFWETVTKTSIQRQASGDTMQNLLRQERAKFDAEEREKRLVASVDGSNDNVDVKIGPFNVSQTKLLLEFFLRQFTSMAESSNRVRAYSKSTVFLDQAYNLAVLLREEGFEDSADDYHQLIETLRAASHRGLFLESVVDIPGTPCVFLTGVEDIRSTRIQRNSSMSSTGIRPTAPLPQTPDELAKNSIKANGHVKQWLTSDISNESNYLKSSITRSANGIKTKTPNGAAVITTSATIEPVVASGPKREDQFNNPPTIKESIHFQQLDNDLDESTDF